jgi:hypothetical protein
MQHVRISEVTLQQNGSGEAYFVLLDRNGIVASCEFRSKAEADAARGALSRARMTAGR